MTINKILSALLGVAVGVITWPIAAIAWPFVCAWYLYNERDDA